MSCMFIFVMSYSHFMSNHGHFKRHHGHFKSHHGHLMCVMVTLITFIITSFMSYGYY